MARTEAETADKKRAERGKRYAKKFYLSDGLALYDALAEAQRTGHPYQTLLDSPPASLRVAHPFDWTRKPFALPVEPRVAFKVPVLYLRTILLEMVFQGNGVLEWEQLRKSCRLLADPDRLTRIAEGQVGSVARQWRQQFCDRLPVDELFDTLSGFCHDRTLRVVPRDGVRMIELLNEKQYEHFPHVRCDARLALAAAATLPPEPVMAEEQQFSSLEAILLS